MKEEIYIPGQFSFPKTIKLLDLNIWQLDSFFVIHGHGRWKRFKCYIYYGILYLTNQILDAYMFTKCNMYEQRRVVMFCLTHYQEEDL